MITVMDGPMGTELDARGVRTDTLAWSATAIETAPEVIAAIHRDYALAGATVHTANTFRTKRRSVGTSWRTLAMRAVEIARQSVFADHLVAGSIAPLMDCYRPDLSPGTASRTEHRELAEVLAEAGCDLLLCETFPVQTEAIVAVSEAVATGLPTWVSFTAGPNADLMTPAEMAMAARHAVDAGACAVCVNCTPATKTMPFLQAIVEANLCVPVGVYANAGDSQDAIGWETDPLAGAAAYAKHAAQWVAAGATLIGGCCGTRPEHIRRLSELRSTFSEGGSPKLE